MRDLKYKTGLKRFLAAILDGFLFLIVALIERSFHLETKAPPLFIGIGVFNSLLPLAYSILLHYKYGQTYGKWVMKVKVLDVSETRTLTLRQAILRDIVGLIVAAGAIIYFFIMSFQSDPLATVHYYYNDFTDQLFFWWTVAELITMLTNNKRRAVHDFMAGSVVVRVEGQY